MGYGDCRTCPHWIPPETPPRSWPQLHLRCRARNRQRDQGRALLRCPRLRGREGAVQQEPEQDKQYTLPDKAVITVPGSVRIGAPELIYQPNLNGMSCKSIDALAWASVSASDIDVRRELCKNIIMSGGSTMYEGMADRLKQELVNRAPSGAEIRVVAAADRKYAVWKGGSTLASLSTFESSWVTKEDYEEHGAAVIHRKCN